MYVHLEIESSSNSSMKREKKASSSESRTMPSFSTSFLYLIEPLATGPNVGVASPDRNGSKKCDSTATAPAASPVARPSMAAMATRLPSEAGQAARLPLRPAT